MADLSETNALTEDIGTAASLNEKFQQLETLADIRLWLTEVYCKAASAIHSGGTGRMRNTSERVKAYIDANLTKDISLSGIAEAVGYSPAYVSKAFRQCCGISYIDYLNYSRIKPSRDLLLKTDLSAKGICFRVGFSNLQSFFRIFKKYAKMTPFQYRKSKKE